jgi:hypothetical protein
MEILELEPLGSGEGIAGYLDIKFGRLGKERKTIILISYKIDGEQLIFDNCTFVPIEYLDWSCLTVGALG